MPRAIYCRPQVASFGLTEEQAREQGHKMKIGRFPFAASGKALALGETEGMVKLVVDSEIGEVLGAHMIGPEVTEMLGELAMTRLLEGTTTELGWAVHPHPTVSEVLKEASLGRRRPRRYTYRMFSAIPGSPAPIQRPLRTGRAGFFELSVPEVLRQAQNERLCDFTFVVSLSNHSAAGTRKGRCE